jgi:DNA processing protein
VRLGSGKYPTSLKKISKPPPLLYLKGKLKSKSNVAIIGTRDISQYADTSVRQAVDLFVKHNYGVVSGLAMGIDTLAHKYSILYKGYTLAVMPNSLDYIYPKENYWLANSILDNGGGVLSELPIGINRGKRSFVERKVT